MNCKECGHPVDRDHAHTSTFTVNGYPTDTHFCSNWCLIQWNLSCLFQFSDDDEIAPYVHHLLEICTGATTRWPPNQVTDR